MDKLAYHYNKKKLPGKTPGTFLYYYPCKRREQANARLEDKSYIVLEITPRQWEMLIELDRLEYNSNHAYSRHSVRMSVLDEDAMPHTMRERCIDKGIPFSYFIHENLDKDKLYSSLSEREQTVLRLCEEKDCTQAEAAKELRVTQGYISRLLKQAREKRFYLKNRNASKDEIVWNYWHYFSSYGETPDYIDVILEFILRSMAGDFLPLLHWFSSFGELCRFVLKCYLFDEDKIEAEITDYLHSATAQEERLGQNVVLRKIPFTTMARKVLPYIDFERAKHTNLNTISTRMKRLLPNHHPHELRHTFISRCKESGVASEVVSIWAGHSLSGTITSTVYTHYSEEFQLKEAEKVVY